EGAGLLTIAPDLDLVAVLGQGDLAAERRRGLLLAPLVGAERTVDVVEPHHAGLHAVVLGVVLAELFGEELLPAVALLRRRRVGVLLTQRRDVGIVLAVVR